LPVARAPSRTFDSQLAIGDELTKVSVRRLSGYAKGPSDFTGLERFFAPEKIDSLTFSVIHTQIVTQKETNRKISPQKRKGSSGLSVISGSHQTRCASRKPACPGGVLDQVLVSTRWSGFAALRRDGASLSASPAQAGFVGTAW
jgi:hypothetical protein